MVNMGGAAPLKETGLFKPLQLGKLKLEHRVVQAPLTRMRAQKESDGVFLHVDRGVEYYKQRASKGGLQLTEATDIFHYVSLPKSCPYSSSTRCELKY